MVIDRLDGRAGEEPHSLAGCHEREFVGDSSTESVEEEPFERMIIQGAECVRDI